jgi:flagellar basal-body rod protein FlgB
MPNAPDLVNRIESGLKGASLRQALIANNLANLDTPGFRRNDTRFESALADAIAEGKPIDLSDADDWIITPGETPVSPNGNDVSLDREVGEMAKNISAYKTYVRLLNRSYRQFDIAMRDNLA